MANETIRQHYVPKTYLKQFSSERNGSFYIRGINKDEIEQERVIEFNTINICLRKNLYTLTGETIEERQKIEKFYSDEIEDNYNTLYSLLIDPNKTTITPDERKLIISTVITMLYRTTKWITEHNIVWNRALESVYTLCKQSGHNHFEFEGNSISIEGKSLKQIQDEFANSSREQQVKTQLEVAFSLIDLRLNDGIFVSKLGKNDCSYITSDNPVVLRNRKGKRIMPFDVDNIISLHIDEKHKLMIMPTRQLSERNLIVRHTTVGVFADFDMMVSNALQMENSEKFILGSETSLKEYISMRKKTERPMTDIEKTETNTLKGLFNKIIKNRSVK
jgi:Protein of unknown function (DUF4238)